MLNAGQNGINVRLLRAGHKTGEFHVVGETLTDSHHVKIGCAHVKLLESG